MTGFKSSSSAPSRNVIAAFIVGAVLGAITVVQIVPNYKGVGSAKATEGPYVVGTTGPEAAATFDPSVVGPTSGPGGGIALPPQASNLKCALGQNGGATDQGVTGNEIRLATTVVESGIGRPFLRDVRFAMEAVKNQTNRAGGICGRKLTIQYVDDGWDPDKGQRFLNNFINESDKSKRIFAIPVGPSSEGLRLVIHNGDIDRAQLPVVGADGMLKDQYIHDSGHVQEWVWPVAAATVASARIMALDAYNSGARTFGIVFDKNYRFGQEAALAFHNQVKKLMHNSTGVVGYNGSNNCQKSYCGIQAGQSSYPNEVREFYRNKVDFVALFLEPQTALTWMSDPNVLSARKQKYGAAQPLFTRDFANGCQDRCDQMTVWTGFKPYIEVYKSDPAVQQYVSALQVTNPQADQFNAFAVGGYVGMKLLVDAINEVGPYLTRQRLKYALDHTKLQTGLTLQSALQWRPGWRWVNTTMQGFTIQYKSAFGGWRAGHVVRDPRPDAGTN